MNSSSTASNMPAPWAPRYAYRVFVGLCLSLLAQACLASTVLRVDMDYLLDHAELVFEGEVLSSHSRWNTTRTAISTYVTFRVDDVIKGDYANPTLELHFAGGQVGEVGMQVSDMDYPLLGEKGIYFVESLQQQLVNPLVGWSQGHFLLLRDENGEERVTTQSRSPVLQLQQDSNEVAADRAVNGAFSRGTATGLGLGETDQLPQALDRQGFRTALKKRLQAVEKQKAMQEAGGLQR